MSQIIDSNSLSAPKKHFKDFSMPVYTTGLTNVIINYTSYMISKSKLSVNFMQVSNPNNTIDHDYIMNEVLYHTGRENQRKGIFRIIQNVDNIPGFSKKLKKSKRINTIVLVDYLESFYEFLEHVSLEYWDVSGYFVVALTQPNEDIYELMEKIFKAFWSKRIVNVVFMFTPHASISEVLLYTYYPFSRGHCENSIPIKLNHYRHNKFLLPIEYFPQKFNNFHGCYLTMVSFINPPFMYFEKHHGSYYLNGIEGQVAIALKNALRSNLRMHVTPERQGRIFKNGTITGKF